MVSCFPLILTAAGPWVTHMPPWVCCPHHRWARRGWEQAVRPHPALMPPVTQKPRGLGGVCVPDITGHLHLPSLTLGGVRGTSADSLRTGT